MPYLNIENFRNGLDARKFKLTMPAGTLTSLVNGHITAGGEIEKRKAFIPLQLPPSTFGAQDTLSGIYVFGSREVSWALGSITRLGGSCISTATAGPSGILPQTGDTIVVAGASDPSFDGNFILTTAGGGAFQWNNAGSNGSATGATMSAYFPAPAIFQQLKHPDGQTQMTAVVCSCEFGSGVLAVALFTDGNSFVYYNGTLITDFYAGLAWSGGDTSYDLAVNLAAYANATGLYTATSPALASSLNITITNGANSTAATYASGKIAFGTSNFPSNNDTVTIGSNVYTFVSVLNNAVPNQILIYSGSGVTNANRLYFAMTGGTGSGTLYSSSTVAPVGVAASNQVFYGFTITASASGTGGNSIVTTVSSQLSPAFASFGFSTLTGGMASVGASQLSTLYYLFSKVVQLTPAFSTNAALIVQTAINWGDTVNSVTVVDATTMAQAIAYMVNTATDTYGGGSGTNLGFVATSSGGTVTITPPVQLNQNDTLTATGLNNIGFTIQPQAANFLLSSIPNTTDGNPFLISSVVNSKAGTLASKLVSLGRASSAGTGASASFTLEAGTVNPTASGTLTLVNTPQVGDNVTIGGVTYTFRNQFSNPAVPNEVAISTKVITGYHLDPSGVPIFTYATYNSLYCLLQAMNGSGNNLAGQAFSIGTGNNPLATASASSYSPSSITVTALLAGVQGNNIGTTSSTANLTWGAATLTGGSDANQVTQVTANGLALLAAYVPFDTDLPTTAADVASAINSNSSNTGYIASVSSATVTVTATAPGSALDGSALAVACGGNICVYNCSFAFSGLTGGSSKVTQIALEILTSGTLVVGQYYKIQTFNSGDVFTNVGAASNAGNIYFVATGTTPTTWTHGSALKHILMAGVNGSIEPDIVYQGSGHSGESVATWVGRIAASINTNTGTAGWCAVAAGATLNISALDTSSGDVLASLTFTDTSVTLTPTSPTITNTVTAFGGGIAAQAGVGETYQVTLSGVWAVGDTVAMTLTNTLTTLKTLVGAGFVTGTHPVIAQTFNNKIYLLAGPGAYFCALQSPFIWNLLAPVSFVNANGVGNGFITMSNFYSASEQLTGIAPYQGKLLFAMRRTVQIWAVDPDPANYSLTQTLPYVGTFAPLSVQPVGDMDVYMAYDSGVRSIRVRDASNNAIIADVGTPIDMILQPIFASLSETQKAACCGIVDPSANRYWLYVPTPSGAVGQIYTFSYWPSSLIAAWGSYTPSYQSAVAAPGASYPSPVPTLTYTGLTVGKRYAWKPGANEVSIICGSSVLTVPPAGSTAPVEGAFVAAATTAVVTGTAAGASYTGALSLTVPFVPSKFVVFQGQVWARSGDMLLQYGGSDNLTYDNCGLGWQIPYLSSDSPGTRKHFTATDAAYEGTWAVNISTDYVTGTFKNVYNNTQSSFQFGRIPMMRYGTHFSMQAVESGSGYARFATALVHFNQDEEKGAP